MKWVLYVSSTPKSNNILFLIIIGDYFIMDNLTGNISTIAVWIYVILAPYISQYITQDVFLALIGIVIAVWSSANPNDFSFLNNDTKPCNCQCSSEESVMNDEYESPYDDEEGC